MGAMLLGSPVFAFLFNWCRVVDCSP